MEIENLLKLPKKEKEALGEDLLDIIVEKNIKIDVRETKSILQIINGHYTKYNIQNMIQVSLRADKEATQNLIKDYLKKTKY